MTKVAQLMVMKFILHLLLGLTASTAAASARNLLVNGTDTEPGEYPYHVRVGCCSGALIAPDVVLSVGHVVPPPDALASMKLYVGAYQVVGYQEEAHAQGFAVKQAWLHPKYASEHYDFSVFLLDGVSSDDVKPVKLNKDNAVPVPGSDVTLLGTGTFDLKTSERPDVLQSAVTKTISDDKCRQAFDPKRGISYAGEFIGPTNLCTFSEFDGCVFDSGGPIVYKDDDEDLLVALISFGVDCADKVYPAVNARVSAAYDWIADLVCEHSQAPPADFGCAGKTAAVAELVNVQVGGEWTGSRSVATVFVMCALVVIFGIATRMRSNYFTATFGEQQRLLPSILA